MLDKIEFFFGPDAQVYVKPVDKPIFVYEYANHKLTDVMFEIIHDRYPEASTALAEIYSNSKPNLQFYKYRVVHRFIRCNFGEFDTHTLDVSEGNFNIEEVKCPMRGECMFEGVICKPKLNVRLTPREFEVAKMLSVGLDRLEIAETLRISPFTVTRHIANIKARLGLKNTQQIIVLFNGRD